MPVDGGMKQPFCLSLDRVGKRFNHRRRSRHNLTLFEDISFTIQAGETFGIMGPSGIGKTTLGRIVVGIEKPTSGRVLFHDSDISRLKRQEYRQYRQEVQMLFQDPEGCFNPIKTLRRSLMDVLGLIACPAPQREGILQNSLAEVGLSLDVLDRYPYQLSGGMNQRAALARVLLLEPHLVILDEPTSALDVSVQGQILNLLKSLQKEKQLSYILISHDHRVIDFMCDRVGVMEDKRLFIR